MILPEEVKKKIKSYYPKIVDTGTDLIDNSDNYEMQRSAAEYGYSIASAEIEVLKGEVERRNKLLEKNVKGDCDCSNCADTWQQFKQTNNI